MTLPRILTFLLLLCAYACVPPLRAVASGVQVGSIRVETSDSVRSDSKATFTLGEVTCIGYDSSDGVNELSAAMMSDHAMRNADEALALLPGLTVRDAGERGEGVFFLRGFDQRGVPVLLDGVPIYIPYEAQLDTRRLSTANLSKIMVEKGAPSLLAGANAMGGVVNLVSTKPVHKFELTAGASTLWDVRLGVGTRIGNWYAQANAVYDKRDFIRLPHKFNPVPGVQDNRHLVNSDRRDLNFNARVGFAPGDDEYSIGYSMIRANKGVPVYLGENGKRRFWRYDPWDKDEVLLHTRTAIAGRHMLESRVYYDRYYNVVRSYDDMNFNTQLAKSAFNSTYDDYSLGANASWTSRFSDECELKAGVSYKHDEHRSHNDGEPTMHKGDNLWSAAAEAMWAPVKVLQFTAGAGVFGQNGSRAEDLEKVDGTETAVGKPLSHDLQFNYQISAAWRFTDTDRLKFSFARTSRFPTLSERYTYKFGKSLPNPYLKSEHSYNFDVTAEGKNFGLSWSVSGFCSLLGDVIQDVTGVDPDNPTVFQPRNCGRGRFLGWEVMLGYTFFKRLTLTANYSYISRVNLTDRGLRFTDVPRHKAVILLDCDLPLGFGVNADWQLNSKALSTSDGALTTPGFGVINLKVSKQFSRIGLQLEAGVKNVCDKLYYYTEGYPQEGRLFFAAVSYKFNLP